MAPPGPWRGGRPCRWQGWERGRDWGSRGASTSGQTAAAGVGTASGMSGVEGIAGAVTTNTTVIGTTVIGTRAVGTTSISTTTVTMTTVTAPGAGARVIVSPVVGAEMGMTVIAVANGAAMTATARAAWRART